jgi:hypothetical protein
MIRVTVIQLSRFDILYSITRAFSVKYELQLVIGFFLGAFAKVRKATISFVMSVQLFVRMEQLGSHWTVFS